MTKFAYILAASHSGSTLLSMLLNAHPDVATVGELAPGSMGDTQRYRCSCGSRIAECPFWQWVGCEARARGVPFRIEGFGTRFKMSDSLIATRLLKPLHRGHVLELVRDLGLRLFTEWHKEFRKIARANEALVELIMEYHPSRIFIDKGNSAVRLKYLLRIPSFDTKVIHLIRDGRAVAMTYMDPACYADASDPSLRGGGNGGEGKGEGLSIAQAAHQWRRANEEAEHALNRLDRSRWIQVRYEELCSNPGATLNSIFEFLGLDPVRHARDFRSVEHHIVGNGMRLDSTSEIRLDDRWKSDLTRDDQRVFNAKAGDVNRRLGY